VNPAPPPELVERFRRDLDALIRPAANIGLAVSGGPDSMALLLLAAAARPGLVHVATVDHGLRAESSAEAEMVAAQCRRLNMPHRTLRPDWPEGPTTAIQEKARAARYALLGQWVRDERLGALVTGHHLDDQAETFVMRLERGAGVKGLAGMRPAAPVPGCPDVTLLRPLLGWRHAELEQLCAAAGIMPACDPSNADHQFERVRVREALATRSLLRPEAIARSVVILGQADAALEWATDQAWRRAVTVAGTTITTRPAGMPVEICRRLVGRAVEMLASEGGEVRGRELDRLLGTLHAGGRATLRGVACTGGEEWRFAPAPARTPRCSKPV
jgi:tRNA(Ile)-lysidine synthase